MASLNIAPGYQRVWCPAAKSTSRFRSCADREQPAAYHRLRFSRDGGEFVEIETTRPELLPACVALVAHPDDETEEPEAPATGARKGAAKGGRR